MRGFASKLRQGEIGSAPSRETFRTVDLATGDGTRSAVHVPTRVSRRPLRRTLGYAERRGNIRTQEAIFSREASHDVLHGQVERIDCEVRALVQAHQRAAAADECIESSNAGIAHTTFFARIEETTD